MELHCFNVAKRITPLLRLLRVIGPLCDLVAAPVSAGIYGGRGVPSPAVASATFFVPLSLPDKTFVTPQCDFQVVSPAWHLHTKLRSARPSEGRPLL